MGRKAKWHSVLAGTTEPPAVGPVQEFPVSGGELGHGPTGRGESRARRRRTVPARRLHRDECPAPESCRRAVLQQARDGGAMDQGRQAGGALDTIVVSPVPSERGPTAAERTGLQPRESLAAAGSPQRIDSWSLTSLQQRLVKMGGRLVKHARYYWLLLAESHLTRRLFGAMLQRISALPVPAG